MVKMKDVAVYSLLTVITMAGFPFGCWILVSPFALTSLYQRTLEGKTAVTIGILMTWIGVVFAVMPPFNVTIPLGLLGLFMTFHPTDMSFLEGGCVSASVTAILFIFTYYFPLLVGFSVGVICVVTVLMPNVRSSTSNTTNQERTVGQRKMSEADYATGDAKDSVTNSDTDSVRDINSTSDLKDSNEETTDFPEGKEVCQEPVDEMSMRFDALSENSSTYSVDEDNRMSAGSTAYTGDTCRVNNDGRGYPITVDVGIGMADKLNVAGEVHGGMGNTYDLRDNSLSVQNNEAGKSTSAFNQSMTDTAGDDLVNSVPTHSLNDAEDRKSDCFDGNGPQVVTDAVVGAANINVAGVVHGGMANKYDVKDNAVSVHDNVNIGTTPDTSSIPSENITVDGNDGSNTNKAGTVYGDVGTKIEMKDNKIIIQNSSISGSLWGSGAIGSRMPESYDEVDEEEDMACSDGNRNPMDPSTNESPHSEDLIYKMTDASDSPSSERRLPQTKGFSNEEESAASADRDTLHFVKETVTEIKEKLDHVNPHASISDQPQQGSQHDVIQIQHDIEVLEKLKKYGRTPVMMAARAGNEKNFFQLSTQSDCDLKKQDKKSNNILHIACLGGNTKIVEYLLNYGIDVESKGQYGRTPAMLAAQKGNSDVFKTLVDSGCDPLVKDADGNAMIHMACIGGSMEIMKYLLEELKYNLNSKGQYGRTPVMIAAEKGHEDVFFYLLEKQCDLQVVDDDGARCGVYAKRGGNANITRRLESLNLLQK